MQLSKKCLLLLFVLGLGYSHVSLPAEKRTKSPRAKRSEKSKKALPVMPDALQKAIDAGDLDAVRKHLSTHKNDIRTVDQEDGLTPLLYAFAALMDNPDQISSGLLLFLIEKTPRSDIDAVGQYGITPLMRAVEYASLPVVQALLKRGANINAMDNDGESVLDHADAGLQYHRGRSAEESNRIIDLLEDSGAKSIESAYIPAKEKKSRKRSKSL